MNQHLYLIGYRGCGKTSVARLLADRLQCAWVDTDVWIETHSKQTIGEIFATEGEGVFRDLESQAISQFASQSPQVVALGGGAVLRSENRQLLRETGLAVWLQAAPEVLAARISSDAQTRERRPSLTGLPVLDEIRGVLQTRLPLYTESADFTLDTNDLTPSKIADLISAWWSSVSYTPQQPKPLHTNPSSPYT